MRRLLSLIAGAAVVAVLAHGLACAAMGSAGPLWIRVHAVARILGTRLPGADLFIAPVIGFTLFRLLSSVQVGKQCWRPAAVVAAFLLGNPFQATEPLPAIWFSLFVFAMMFCSVATARPAPAD